MNLWSKCKIRENTSQFYKMISEGAASIKSRCWNNKDTNRMDQVVVLVMIGLSLKMH